MWAVGAYWPHSPRKIRCRISSLPHPVPVTLNLCRRASAGKSFSSRYPRVGSTAWCSIRVAQVPQSLLVARLQRRYYTDDIRHYLNLTLSAPNARVSAFLAPCFSSGSGWFATRRRIRIGRRAESCTRSCPCLLVMGRSCTPDARPRGRARVVIGVRPDPPRSRHPAGVFSGVGRDHSTVKAVAG